MSASVKTMYLPSSSWGTCVWAVEDDMYLASDSETYLSMEGLVGSKIVETKMENAAKYWMGSDFRGRPLWLPDTRKVSDMERDDQMARLLDGKVPDEVDVVRQVFDGA